MTEARRVPAAGVSLILAAAACMWASPVPAQVVEPTPSGAAAMAPVQETLLRLAETAELDVQPDQITASLRIDGVAETASGAQAQANRRAQAAIQKIRAVAGIEVETGGYWTSREQERGRWRAVQTLELRASEGPPMFDLVGSLQGDGLALQRLSWGLSREAQRRAREQATTLALQGLRDRAETIAGTLGLGFAGFREVRVDAPRMSHPVPMRAASMATSAAPPPVAEPGIETVSATVEADALLRSR